MPRLSKIGAAALAAFGWTSGSSVTATYLVVAGGAGGGGALGGGGGAGGYQTGTASLNPTLSYTVTVGAGGAAGVTDGTEQGTQGGDGTNSVFNTVTSAGGGGGGTAGPSGGTAGLRSGRNGGSGGGGAGNDQQITSGGTGNTPSTSPSQGNNGGSNSTQSNPYPAAGGGGATAVGSNGSGSQSGAGGNGTASSISGASVTYAGGGGGGSSVQGAASGSGGTGGGGAGQTSSVAAVSGTANTGGGGGGGRNAANVTAGKGGSGVVIISYPGAQQFGGGVVTTDGTNTIHTFTTSGTLVPATPLTAQFLVVGGGGGGGGGSGFGGGGGAGGFLSTTGVTIDTNSNYVVTVGAGGAASTGGNGGSGTLSSFLTLTAAGGGYGGGFNTVGASGGSGGGGGESQNGGSGNTPSTTPSQGSNGGKGSTTSNGGGGGGGGASAVGGSPTNTSGGGAGGAGSASSISGTSTYYAGGGGGCTATTPAPSGGTGGGGNGSFLNNIPAVAGTANTGGGGGGGYLAATYTGAAGGSGIVIIAYPGSTQQMAGGTVTISGGNVIHTFTSSGYLTPIKYASRSLRFRSSASAYLNRTPATAGNVQTYTISFWVKRGVLSTQEYLFVGFNGSASSQISFNSGDTLQVNIDGNTGAQVITSAVYRDPSAWYHIVVAVDTTQATASNRIKLYVNGSQVTAFGTTSYPSQNANTYFFAANGHWIGSSQGPGQYFDGYLTEFNAVNGQALTPSSFGTFNSYGVWQPITYGGSYGTNGFYLTFGNNTSTTTLGYDTSPQGNNWTTNNISLTTGATYDSMTDVPTLTSATVANYCVLNPIFTNGFNPLTLTNANLTATSASGARVALGTMYATTDAYYFEATCTTVAAAGSRVGIRNDSTQRFYDNSGNYFDGATSAAYGATYTTGDVIGVAFDLTNQTITFYKNNTSQGQKTAIGLTGILVAPFVYADTSGVWNLNFGQRPFTYTPPSGFVALNTYNLSTPTIPNGAAQFAATLYTGTNATLAITNTVNGTAMQPDWLWVKRRDAVGNSLVWDVVRGVTKGLNTSTTGAEQTATGGTGLASFNSNGFTLGGDFSGTGSSNTSAATYVAWQWKANGTGVTNTSGSITSTVSANTTAGFSVVTYTESGTYTVGHGLGVAPSMIILKERDAVGSWIGWTNYWAAPTKNGLYFSATNAPFTTGSNWLNSTTSTVFGITGGQITSGSAQIVAYCFAAIAGYSAIGNYTGNGSADGVFVFLGFRARFLMIKRIDSTGGWVMLDTARDTYNDVDNYLYANSSAADAGSSNVLDINSNGFKIRNSWTDINASGGTYIYMAFAENPFKYANAR